MVLFIINMLYVIYIIVICDKISLHNAIISEGILSFNIIKVEKFPSKLRCFTTKLL